MERALSRPSETRQQTNKNSCFFFLCLFKSVKRHSFLLRIKTCAPPWRAWQPLRQGRLQSCTGVAIATEPRCQPARRKGVASKANREISPHHISSQEPSYTCPYPGTRHRLVVAVPFEQYPASTGLRPTRAPSGPTQNQAWQGCPPAYPCTSGGTCLKRIK